jgi:hypothetical protein
LIRFHLEGLSYDLNLSKGDLWQALLEKRTTKLKRFDLASLRIWLGNNADDDDDNDNNLNIIDSVTHSFGQLNAYWNKQWSICQMHKLRPNHLDLNLRARAL